MPMLSPKTRLAPWQLTIEQEKARRERIEREQVEKARREGLDQLLKALQRLVEEDEHWQLRTNRPNKLGPAVPPQLKDIVEDGNVAFDAQDYEQALQYYSMALDSGLGASPELLSNLAVALLLSGRYEECIAVCGRSLETWSHFPPLHLQLARANRCLGRFEAAQLALLNAQCCCPAFAPELQRERFLVLLEQRDRDLGFAAPSVDGLLRLLGLAEAAHSPAELLAAFRRAALPWHPSEWRRHPEEERDWAAQELRRRMEAYHVWSDRGRLQEWQQASAWARSIRSAAHLRRDWVLCTGRGSQSQLSPSRDTNLRQVPLYSPLAAAAADKTHKTPPSSKASANPGQMQEIFTNLPSLRSAWAPPASTADHAALLTVLDEWRMEHSLEALAQDEQLLRCDVEEEEGWHRGLVVGCGLGEAAVATHLAVAAVEDEEWDLLLQEEAAQRNTNIEAEVREYFVHVLEELFAEDAEFRQHIWTAYTQGVAHWYQVHWLVLREAEARRGIALAAWQAAEAWELSAPILHLHGEEQRARRALAQARERDWVTSYRNFQVILIGVKVGHLQAEERRGRAEVWAAERRETAEGLLARQRSLELQAAEEEDRWRLAYTSRVQRRALDDWMQSVVRERQLAVLEEAEAEGRQALEEEYERAVGQWKRRAGTLLLSALEAFARWDLLHGEENESNHLMVRMAEAMEDVQAVAAVPSEDDLPADALFDVTSAVLALGETEAAARDEVAEWEAEQRCHLTDCLQTCVLVGWTSDTLRRAEAISQQMQRVAFSQLSMQAAEWHGRGHLMQAAIRGAKVLELTSRESRARTQMERAWESETKELRLLQEWGRVRQRVLQVTGRAPVTQAPTPAAGPSPPPPLRPPVLKGRPASAWAGRDLARLSPTPTHVSVGPRPPPSPAEPPPPAPPAPAPAPAPPSPGWAAAGGPPRSPAPASAPSPTPNAAPPAPQPALPRSSSPTPLQSTSQPNRPRSPVRPQRPQCVSPHGSLWPVNPNPPPGRPAPAGPKSTFSTPHAFFPVERPSPAPAPAPDVGPRGAADRGPPPPPPAAAPSPSPLRGGGRRSPPAVGGGPAPAGPAAPGRRPSLPTPSRSPSPSPTPTSQVADAPRAGPPSPRPPHRGPPPALDRSLTQSPLEAPPPYGSSDSPVVPYGAHSRPVALGLPKQFLPHLSKRSALRSRSEPVSPWRPKKQVRFSEEPNGWIPGIDCLEYRRELGEPFNPEHPEYRLTPAGWVLDPPKTPPMAHRRQTRGAPQPPPPQPAAAPPTQQPWPPPVQTTLTYPPQHAPQAMSPQADNRQPLQLNLVTCSPSRPAAYGLDPRFLQGPHAGAPPAAFHPMPSPHPAMGYPAGPAPLHSGAPVAAGGWHWRS